ncbi:uncharacterized protein LOC110925360 [Helianthus annuus]|uniref:uncharacterized protein LOC110925360 n=1 Tax=Helianthus annuus TaxID=4232 RepID=UPI000B8FB351|nr:uncharacterized protein LOC110925360 [Helianthus annuus]
MDPYNSNNLNSSSLLFSSPGYTPVMENSFSGYQQMPNVFNQRNQYHMQQPNIPFNQMQMQPNPQTFNMPYQQMQMQQLMQNPINMSYQPPPQARPTQIEEEDDDVEVVPETQPQTSKRKNTKEKGNNQSNDGFWQEILDIFHTFMEQGEYRNIDSIGSKWRKMNTVIQRFCGFYNQTLSNKPSGWNHENVFHEVMRLYENEHKSSFPHVRAWQVVKDSPKWAVVLDEVASAKRATKRPKTSESGSYSVGASTGRCQININEEPEFDEEPI